MDREFAILIYKGIIYKDCNHQLALEFALKENGESFDYDLEHDIDKVADLTKKLNKESVIYNYSVYVDGDKTYIVSHFKEDLRNTIDLIKEYADNNNMILATFISDVGYDCKIIKEDKDVE